MSVSVPPEHSDENTLHFFPWTEQRGNRWRAFATENTLFMSEKTGSQRQERLDTEKKGNMKISCEQGGTLKFGCYFQSHCKNNTRKLCAWKSSMTANLSKIAW